MSPVRIFASPVASPLAGFSDDVRRALRIDIVAALLVSSFTSLTGPFTGLILRRELGATPLQLSVLAAAGAAFMLSSLVWARAVERRTPLPCVVWAGFVGRGLFLLVPFIRSAWGFVAVLVAANVLNTVAAPATAALAARVYPREQRGRALGVVRAVGALPGIAVVLGAGTALRSVDYTWPFVVAALLGMAASLQLRRLPVPEAPPEPLRARAGVRSAWRALRDDRALRGLMVSASICGSAIWIQMPAHPVLMADVLHVDTAQIGVFAALATAAGFVANAVWGRLADRRGSLRALRAVYVVGAVTPIVDVFITSPRLLALSYVTDAMLQTGLDLVMTLAIAEVAGRRRTAEYAAIAATLGGIRGVVGPFVGGFLIDHAGVRTVYALAAVIMLAAIGALSWQIRRPAARPAADAALAA